MIWSRMTAACSAHLFGERRRRGVGLVDDHAERRLERMGEIADLGAGALDNVAIGANEQVQLVDQRRDFDGIALRRCVRARRA